MKLKIAGFGVACIDYIAVASEVDSAGYSQIQSYTVAGGGITGTSCVAASRLGADVTFLSRLGDDTIGDQILDTLRSENIDVSQVIRVPGGKSLFSWIRVDPETGERAIYSRKDFDISCPVDLIAWDSIRNASALLLDDHWPEGARYVALKANQEGIPIVCDVRLRPENYDLMASVDYAVISSGYAVGVSGDGSPESALNGILDLGAKNAVITCGESGAWYTDGSVSGFIPAFKVDVVDTTGAGDVFHGAFAVAIAKGLDLNESVLFASAVSALKCTGLGGRENIPDMKSTLAFLDSRNVSINKDIILR